MATLFFFQIRRNFAFYHSILILMKIGIMQPYFLPYLGYFQLMAACDQFVVYDNIKFTKKGWINRNRMLLNGADHMFTLPLRNDSDFLDVDQRFLGDNFEKEKNKILGQVRSAYARAPQFSHAYPVIEEIFSFADRNLFHFIWYSLLRMREYLGITTPLVVSSTVEIDHALKGKYKVMELCKALSGDAYINPIGGMELYDKDEFRANGIGLQFHKMKPVIYRQFGDSFITSLSVLDVIMFNDKDTLGRLLTEFDLI